MIVTSSDSSAVQSGSRQVGLRPFGAGGGNSVFFFFILDWVGDMNHGENVGNVLRSLCL